MTTVIVCGVLTNLCCETTARSAFVHDYSVWFLGDGTASRRPDLHTASILNLEYGVARVMTCRQAMARVREREKAVLQSEVTHHTTARRHPHEQVESHSKSDVDEKVADATPPSEQVGNGADATIDIAPRT